MRLAKAAEAAEAAFKAAETETRDDAEILHGDGRFQQRAYLTAMGLPFDAVMAFSDAELIAWTVAFGEIEGATWDWQEGAWAEPAHIDRRRLARKG